MRTFKKDENGIILFNKEIEQKGKLFGKNNISIISLILSTISLILVSISTFSVYMQYKEMLKQNEYTLTTSFNVESKIALDSICRLINTIYNDYICLDVTVTINNLGGKSFSINSIGARNIYIGYNIYPFFDEKSPFGCRSINVDCLNVNKENIIFPVTVNASSSVSVICEIYLPIDDKKIKDAIENNSFTYFDLLNALSSKGLSLSNNRYTKKTEEDYLKGRDIIIDLSIPNIKTEYQSYLTLMEYSW